MNSKKLIFTIFLLAECFTASFGQFGGYGYGSSNFSSHYQYNYFNYIQTYHRKKDNGDNVDFYYRGQTGVTFGFIAADYKLDYTYSNGSTTGGIKDYFSGNLERKVSGMVFGVSGEHYYPLNKINDRSLIAFTLGTEMLYLKLKFDEIRINGGQRFTPEHNILITNIPLGLAYKSGTDAALKSNVKSGFSIGAGAMANINMDLGPAGGFPSFNLQPYCMAEMSFYTGFCWKIRGTAYLGQPILGQGAEEIGLANSDQDVTLKITAKPTVLLSLIMTDFSWDWDEE